MNNRAALTLFVLFLGALISWLGDLADSVAQSFPFAVAYLKATGIWVFGISALVAASWWFRHHRQWRSRRRELLAPLGWIILGWTVVGWFSVAGDTDVMGATPYFLPGFFLGVGLLFAVYEESSKSDT